MKRSVNHALLIFLLILGVVVSACTSQSSTQPGEQGKNQSNQQTQTNSTPPVNSQTPAAPAPAQASGGKYTLGISLPAADHGWMGALIANAKEESKKYSNIETIVYTAKDPAKQTSDIEDLITKKVNAIVMLPIESGAMTPAADKVAKAGIPLIVVDRAVNTENYRTYIGGDNYGIGFGDAKYLVNELIKRKGKPEGNVIEIAGVPSSVTDLRSKGFRDYIKDYPGITIIASQPGDFTREKALKATENILQANKQIDAVYSQDDDMTIGIVQAIKDARRENEMFIVSSGGMKEIYQMIKDKSKPEVIVSLTYSPTMSGSAVFLASKILEGKSLEGFWEKGVPHHIILEATPVTAENVDQFLNPNANY